jgi:hypothetical protein
VLRKPPKDLTADEDVFQIRFTKEILRDYTYPLCGICVIGMPLGLAVCIFFLMSLDDD